MFNNCIRNLNTVDEIGLSTLTKLIQVLDLSPENDWENIARSFPKYFNIYDINLIKQDMKKGNYSPSQAVLETLRNNLVPINKLYACLVEYQLVGACNILEKNYPNDTVYKRSTQTLNNSSPQLQPLTTSTRQFDNFENQDLKISQSFQPPNQSVSNVSLTDGLTKQNEPQILNYSNNLYNLLEIFESILPVIHENSEPKSDPIMRPSSYLNYESILPVGLRVYGKFETCPIKERRLTFKKKEFFEPYDYLRELKMIKHRHNNLYTAECILKNSLVQKSHFLLYHNENYPSKLLTEYARQNLQTLLPSQFNIENQLDILIDVASALNYLHNKDEHKVNRILHGNLQADSIIIYMNHPYCTAKLADFTCSIEDDGSQNLEEKTLDEFNSFGLIVFMVLTWDQMRKEDSEKIHQDEKNYNDIREYTYTLFTKYKIDKQPKPSVSQTLLRIYYALTSSNYDVTKGIKKSSKNFEKLRDDIRMI